MLVAWSILFLYAEQFFTKDQMLAVRKFFDYRENVKKILETIDESNNSKSL